MLLTPGLFSQTDKSLEAASAETRAKEKAAHKAEEAAQKANQRRQEIQERNSEATLALRLERETLLTQIASEHKDVLSKVAAALKVNPETIVIKGIKNLTRNTFSVRLHSLHDLNQKLGDSEFSETHLIESGSFDEMCIQKESFSEIRAILQQIENHAKSENESRQRARASF